MEIKIGDDCGIAISFGWNSIRVESVDGGYLTTAEARMAADALNLMAAHMEASTYGD